jgi:hypothetical protein
MAAQEFTPSIGHSQEQVAFMLLEKIAASEIAANGDSSPLDREWLLATYAECLITIQNPHIKWKP